MGHLRKRGNSWQVCIYTPTGRYHETISGSRADAKARMIELEATHSKGVPLPKGRLTVGKHLDDWLNDYAKSCCALRTVDGYESIIERHLKPALGHIQLKELQPRMIQVYYGKAVEKLSPRTATKHHRLLSQSLKYAVRQGLLGRNRCDLVSPPRWKGKTMRTLTPGELEVLLEGASESQFYPVIYTAVSTGLRQAELLGLRWRDTDLDLLSISVSQTLYKRRGIVEFKETKTAHSRRRVAMTPKLASYLRAYRLERQLEELKNSTQLIDILHSVLLLWEKGRRDEMVKLLNKSGYGMGEAFYRVAQAISETLPIDSKEKKLLDGCLSGRERLREEVRKEAIQRRLL